MRFDKRTYFITVAETKNISKAAQILHVSQPSLSQYISRLEEDIGWKLLNRNSNPITLTEAGELYLEYLREVMAAADRFSDKLNNLKSQYADSIRIGLPSQLYGPMFNDFVGAFMRKYPSVNVVAKEGTSIALRDMLIRGEVDIAIHHTDDDTDSRFQRYIMYKERLCFSCNADLPFLKGRKSSRKKPIKLTPEILSELSNMRFLQPPEEYLLSTEIDRFCEPVGIRQRKIQRLPNIKTIAEYIAMPGSDGVSVLPEFLSTEVSDWDKIAFVASDEAPISWNLSMDRFADNPITETEELFWDMTISTAKKMYK